MVEHMVSQCLVGDRCCGIPYPPSFIVGLCRGSLRSLATAFFVLALTILVPLALYHACLFLATWSTATWVILAAVCVISANFWWLYTQLSSK